MAEQTTDQQTESYLGSVRANCRNARKFADDNDFAMADAHLEGAKVFLRGIVGLVESTNPHRRGAENIYITSIGYVADARGEGS